MIKINRIAAPSYLDIRKKVELTKRYLATGEDVWNHKSIRNTLLLMSFEKCAYCEIKISDESKYLEVDHFLYKGGYPERVVEWYNLLPSCKRCNTTKGTYDPFASGMIIDPSIAYPKLHLRMVNFRIFGRDKLGTDTEQELGLNDAKRLVSPRMKIGDAAAQTLNQARSDMVDYLSGKNTNRQKNKIVRNLSNLLGEALPDSPFSATVATCIDGNPDYIWLVKNVEDQGWWSVTLDELHKRMKAASLL